MEEQLRKIQELERRLARLEVLETPLKDFGPAFPTSNLFTGRRWFLTGASTDPAKNIEYFYDGTRWLSNRFTDNFNFDPGITIPFNNAGGTSTGIMITSGPHDSASVYLERFIIVTNVNTTLDNANKWTLELFRQNNTPTNISFSGGVQIDLFQVGRVAGTRYYNSLTINAVFAANDILLMFLSATKVGAPGTLGLSGTKMWYRLVGS